MLKLMVIEGNASGQQIPVDDELIIGRTGSEDGRLADDPELSRQHARFIRQGDAWVIEDLGSMNGTFVNGNRLAAPHRLSDGDQIEVGGTRMVTQLSAPPPSPEPEASGPPEGLGATRIASVPDSVPEPPAEGPSPTPDTFVPQPEPTAEMPPADPGAPPPAGPQAPPPPPGPPGPPPAAAQPGPEAPTDLPPPSGPPQETVTPAPVPPAPPPNEPEPADLPPPSGPPQDTVTPAPTPVEEAPRVQDTEVPEPEAAPEAAPEAVPEPEPEPRTPVSLRVQIDVDAGEATIELDEGGDRVTLRQEDGRWVLGS